MRIHFSGHPLPTSTSHSSVLRVDHIDIPAAFANLREEWNELLAASASNCFFLTWEWLYTWWKHLSGRRRLSLLLVRDRQALLAIAPLVLRPPAPSRLLPFPALEFLGSGPVGSDYLDVIIRRGAEKESIDLLAGALTRFGYPLELGYVRRESSNAAGLAHRLREGQWGGAATPVSICPRIDLTGHSWESYLASLGAAHRYNFKRRLKNLQRRWAVQLQIVENEADRDEVLKLLIRLHNRRWKNRGGSEAFSTPALVCFHDEVSRLALARGWLRLFVLRLDDRPAAVFQGYRYASKFYFFQSAFDDAFAQDSVGLVIMGLAIRHALEEGAAEFDLLRGAEAYKFHWASGCEELNRLELFPPGIHGRLLWHLAAAGSRIRGHARKLVGDAMADRLVTRGSVSSAQGGGA